MLKMVILDDEPLIVEGLASTINWGAMGLSVAGVAYNGIDGKALIHSAKPDVVIADIVMPGLTGLDLLACCGGEDIKFILLSAHNDFSFAQQAVRQHASDYILKPIDSDKLIRAVKNAVKEIEHSKKITEHISRLEQSAKQSEPIALSRFLLDIARNGPDILDSRQQATLENLYSKGLLASVTLYNLPVDENKAILLRFTKEIESEFEANALQYIRDNAEEALLYLFPIDDAETIDLVCSNVKTICKACGERFYDAEKVVCISAVSTPYDDLSALPERYDFLKKSIAMGFFAEGPTVLLQDMAGEKKLPMFDCNQLIFELEHGNLSAMIEEHTQVKWGLQQLKDKDFAIYTYHELYRRATNIASKAGMIYKPIVQNRLSNENFEAISQKSLQYFNDICTMIRANQSALGKLTLLVDEFYTDSTFGLAAAADRLGLSPAHLSRLFKKESGGNFSDYLVKKRIERAQYLLRTTGLKNHEVAASVGFEDDHYFRQVFKKKCGMTPKMYRERHAKQ